MSEITKEQIDGLLPFLDTFERADFTAGTWEIKPGQFPFLNYDDSVDAFQKSLRDHGWIVPFDWPAWQNRAEEYVNDPKELESATPETIQKLLTTHSRKERFCEGHLAAMIECGHVAALLRRLESIRATMDN